MPQRFRVYYSDNSRQLVVSDYKLGAAYVTSTTLETTLTGLLSCEDYFVRVQQVEPTVGRLSDIRSERTDRGTSPAARTHAVTVDATAAGGREYEPRPQHFEFLVQLGNWHGFHIRMCLRFKILNLFGILSP